MFAKLNTMIIRCLNRMRNARRLPTFTRSVPNHQVEWTCQICEERSCKLHLEALHCSSLLCASHKVLDVVYIWHKVLDVVYMMLNSLHLRQNHQIGQFSISCECVRSQIVGRRQTADDNMPHSCRCRFV